MLRIIPTQKTGCKCRLFGFRVWASPVGHIRALRMLANGMRSRFYQIYGVHPRERGV